MKKVHSILSLILILFAAGALSAQTVVPSPTSMSFSAQVGGTPVSQTLTLGGTATPQFVLSDAGWLKLSTAANPTPATSVSGTPGTLVTVTADPAGLSATTYTGHLNVFTAGGASVLITVTFAVGNLGVSPGNVNFTYQAGAVLPNATVLTLTSASSLAYAVTVSTNTGGNWLAISQSSGTSPGSLTVSLNPAVVGASMAPGQYTGSLSIQPALGPAIAIPVTLTVTAAPTVTASAAAVNLNYQIGGASGTTNNASTTVTLTNPGTQDLAFGAASTAPWLSVTPATGTIPANNGTATITISYIQTQNLPQGTYNGSVTVFVSGAANPQIPISTKLTVSTAPLLTVPSSTLAFAYQMGGAVPATKTVVATSSQVAADSAVGQMALTITKSDNSSWLTIPTTGGTGSATPIVVSVSPAGLAVGTYTATISVSGTGAANNPQTIPVSLTVSNDPMIVASFGGCSSATTTCPMNFPVQLNGSAVTTQTINVKSSTGAQASFTPAVTMDAIAACGNSWLVSGVTTAQVTAEANFLINVVPGTIPAGTTCTGHITITGTNPANGAALPNSPVTIPVRMDVSSNPLLVANPIALSFALGQNATDAKTITLTSTSSNIAYTVSTASSWLIPFPTSATTAAGGNAITVAASTTGLVPGKYDGTITITATTAGVQNTGLTIPVTLTVNAATMTVSKPSLSFQQTRGGNAPASQTFTVSTDSTDINFSTSVTMTDAPTGGWLFVSPTSGTATKASPSQVTVLVNGASLDPGTYHGSVTVTSPFASGSPATIAVTLQVLAGTVSTNPTSLTFSQVRGGPAPAPQTVTVTSSPSGLAYTVATSTDGNTGNWLTVTPTSGTTGTTSVQVSVNASSLAVGGPYTGKVTITAAGATPVDIPVSVNVLAPQTFTVSPTSLNFSYIIGASTTPQPQTVQLTGGTGVPFTTKATTTSGGNWLNVSPASASGSGALTVAVNVTGLAAGNYTGTVAVSSPNSATDPAATVTVNLTVTAIPKPVITSIANAASYTSGAISPGENIVIFGTGIGPAQLASATLSNNAFPTKVGNTQVFFDNTPAPILYVSGTQTSVMVPYGIAGRSTTSIKVVYSDVTSDAVPYTVTAATPGVYTANSAGSGQGAILNQDYSYNGPAGTTGAKPADKNSVVTLYATGEGFTTGTDGVIAPTNGSGLFKPSQAVTATVGGLPATVEYYGTAPGIVYGVMQVNVRIPANAPSGSLPVVLSIGSATTQSNVTVAVQ